MAELSIEDEGAGEVEDGTEVPSAEIGEGEEDGGGEESEPAALID